MPLYLYNCPACGPFDSLTRSNGIPCPACGILAKRKWSYHRGNVAFQPHYNYAVGQYVNTDKEFRDALKRGADAAGTTYTPHYPGDIPEPKTDTEILETQSRTWHDMEAKGKARIETGEVLK